MKNNKTLRMYVFDKKEKIFGNVVASIYVLLVIVAVVVLSILDYSPFWVLLTLPLFIVGFFIMYFKISTYQKLIKLVNVDLDYEAFSQMADKISQNNLHPETRNLLNLMRVNFLLAYDRSQAQLLLNDVKRPINANHSIIYDNAHFTLKIYNKEFQEAQALIEGANIKMKSFMENYYDVFATTKEMDVEQIYPLNDKLPLNVASRMYIIMSYYDIRGNTQKAVEYANMVLSYCPKLKAYCDDAKEIIEKKN